MTQKPKVQYVGQFYVHGSEAKKLAQEQRRKEARTKLPMERLRRMEAIYIDPVALLSIAVALVMFAVMVWGAMEITQDWVDYRQMNEYVSELNLENARLVREYRENIDLEDIETKALALGMVTKDQVPHRSVRFSVPQRLPEPTRWERMGEFWKGLFA